MSHPAELRQLRQRRRNLARVEDCVATALGLSAILCTASAVHRGAFVRCNALALPPTLAIPSINRVQAPPPMGNKKPKSKAPKGPNSRNGSRARVGADASSALERSSINNGRSGKRNLRTYEIPDYRLEHPQFHILQRTEKDRQGQEHVRYEVTGDLDAPIPPIRDSKYLDKQQAIEIYRYMLLNRKMEIALENLYKQGKVVGGVYFGLGQEACSCASAYALDKDDWFAPMIRNQGSLLVRGFRAADTMMQYMAKADSPTKGRDGT